MIEPAPLTERQAIKLLVARLPSGNIYMPRFTPEKWWENDLCAVTKAGYWTEFEVKLTRQDFLKDKTKDVKRWEGSYPNMVKVVENKHELMTATARGPNRFYFAVREGVASVSDMPPWAGLLVFKWEEYGDGKNGEWVVRQEQQAPLRHRNNSLDVTVAMYRAAWYRGIGSLL